MYSLTTSDGQIFLYEGGQHDHTGVRIPNLPTMAPSVELDLQSMLKQALPSWSSFALEEETVVFRCRQFNRSFYQ